MKLAIMQPYFLPYIGYFQLMAAVDRFVLLDDVNFINRGWINRNRILVGGLERLITIPLRGASQNQYINQIALDSSTDWRATLSKTIAQNYRKAAYYDETMPLVQAILDCPEAALAPYLQHSLQLLHGWLELPCELVPSSAQYENRELKGAQRILDICRREQADIYLNPPGGTALYEPAEFAAQGMQLRFLQPQLRPYPQGREPFTPGLSIIDVLMHCGRTATRQSLFLTDSP